MAIDDGPVIVGGGPAGLAAAIELRELGISPVTVIEREREAGGIPRHSDHTGFGLRDQRTVLSGPKYAARYRDLAEEAAVEVLTETMVTEWEGARQLKLTGPHGRWEIEPPGRRPRHRLPGTTPFRAPRPRLAASRCDDHRHASAAGPPARPEGRAASGDRRSRARQLLSGRDSGARRRLCRRAGHGAARSINRCGPSGPERPSAIARPSGPGPRSARSMAPSGSSRSS